MHLPGAADVSATTTDTKVTARESKKRQMQHFPTVLERSVWPGGCFSSIKNPARKKSIAGCGRNRGSKFQFSVAFTEICRMLVGENTAIINLNLLETHGKLGLAPRVNLVFFVTVPVRGLGI